MLYLYGKYLNTILYKFWPVQVMVAISAEGCRPLRIVCGHLTDKGQVYFLFQGHFMPSLPCYSR